MFIGLTGAANSGKYIVEQYLVDRGFTAVTHEDAFPARAGGADRPEQPLVFSSFNELYDHTTLHWQEDFVMADIVDGGHLELLRKRPYFLHVAVDTTLEQKYKQFLAKHGSTRSADGVDDLAGDLARGSINGSIGPTGSDFSALAFIRQFDLDARGAIGPPAHVRVFITATDRAKVWAHLDRLNLTDPARLRPPWDAYFMSLADLAALRANCMKRRVGCVIVKDRRVVATGYNGTPRHLQNCNAGGCARCNAGNAMGALLGTCLCLHAEENALLEAGRDRIGDSSTLYCNTCPCLTCSVKIVQTGIKEVVYAQSYSMDDAAHRVFEEAGVVLRQYCAPEDEVML